MQMQFILRNRKKINIFELWRHQWRNDDAMHLSVNKLFYFSERLALIMNTQYNELNKRTDKHALCLKLH